LDLAERGVGGSGLLVILMAAYSYTARDRGGATLRGAVEAINPTAAAEALRGRGLLLLELIPQRSAARSLFDLQRWLPLTGSDIESGLRQLAVMHRAGLTVTEALDALSESSSVRVSWLWRAIGARVREGATFAQALERHRVIPALIIQLVRVGETTGELDIVLERGADALEARRRLRAAVLSALFYPAFVTLAAIGVAAALVFYLVPKLTSLLSGLGRKLPWSTQLLVDISTWLQVYGMVLAGGLALGAAAIALCYATASGRLAIDRLLLRTPIIGPTIRLGGTVLLCRSLATLVASGVAMIEALSIIERLLANRDQQMTTALARARVTAGEQIAPALREGGAFTPLVPQLVATGERTGALDRVLEHLADYHEEQLQRRIRWLGMIIEPVMIIVVGGMVGFVYLAFFQAVYGAIGGIR
jgi:type IV pilus assembly protein PilC